MEPGPLPPHERSWRHPSELGPTRIDVDPGPHHHLAALAIGAVAVLAVAAMVVAMTPRSGSSPVAVSATTAAPGATVPGVTAPGVTVPGVTASTPSAPASSGARIPISLAPVGMLMTSFSALPHAVTSDPQLTLDGADVADELPDSDDIVSVRTEAVTYELPWGQVADLAAPEGTVVFDAAGDLLARVSGGEMVTLVDG